MGALFDWMYLLDSIDWLESAIWHRQNQQQTRLVDLLNLQLFWHFKEHILFTAQHFIH